MKTLTKTLHDLGACGDAIAWVSKQKGDAQAIWERCAHGDWMMWYAGRCIGRRGSKAHRAVVFAAAACARTALNIPEREAASRAAIELAERWARGDNSITAEQLRDAANAVYSDADADCATVFTAAAAAVSAAAADSITTAAAAAAATRHNARVRMAHIVCQFIPQCPRMHLQARVEGK